MIGFRLCSRSAGSSIRAASARRVNGPTFPVSAQRIQSRHVHNRLQLPYNIDEGLGEFLPPQALKVVAEEYQQGLLERLNEEVVGTHLRGLSVVHTIIQASKDPSRAMAFNYASEALNNSFFLGCLSPPPKDRSTHEDDISNDLHQAINVNFGNLEQLKSTFSAAVNGMRTQGYVWLLVDGVGNLAVYPTFGNGTLLVRSTEFLPAKAGAKLSQTVVGEESHITPGSYRLRSAPPASSSPASGSSQAPPPLNPHTQTRSYVAGQDYVPANIYGDRAVDVSKIGEKLFPLFCVSVHEHAWMSAGYGVWGKEEWIKKFWSVVNWGQVSTHFIHYLSNAKQKKQKQK
ncbi:Manganese/iron superoxide dismutase [Irpex rosettiformis]|uniref:Manganese/iron superoxide dismutase n=1 Tax=Irpex rosettiformis TaxID=378272 RepID=A0ACB8UED2_9APHY|nr:Manganese/iron superoxide dismutase [Irpex rosettiformis]